MNVTRRQQLLGLVAIATVAFLAGDRLLFTPLARAWEARWTEVANLKKSVAQGTLLLDRERAIRSRWQFMRTNSLPEETSVAENLVLRAFDRWSQASRITVTSVRPQWKRTEDDYATLECRMDASGSLPALTRFLYDLEKDPLGLKVEVVELTSRDARGDQLTLGLQVSALMIKRAERP